MELIQTVPHEKFSQGLKNTGFTMVELLIAMVVGSILVSLAVPAFDNLIETNRITSATNKFKNAISITRSEAVKRGRQVSLLQVSASASGEWHDGWCVAVGEPDDCSGTNLFEHQKNTKVVISSTNSVYSFDAKGYSESPADVVSVCIAGNTEGRAITVNAIGQTRVATKPDC